MRPQRAESGGVLLYLSGGAPHRVDVQVDDPAQRLAAVHQGASTLSVFLLQSCAGDNVGCGEDVSA